jgi:hypothetical protein
MKVIKFRLFKKVATFLFLVSFINIGTKIQKEVISIERNFLIISTYLDKCILGNVKNRQ